MTTCKEQPTTNEQMNLNSNLNVNLSCVSDSNNGPNIPSPNAFDPKEIASPRIKHALGSGVRQHWREILCKPG